MNLRKLIFIDNISFTLFFIFIFFILPLSMVVAFRDYSVGKDTLSYLSIYNGINDGDFTSFEPGFSVFTIFLHWIYDSFRFFLFGVVSVITFSYGVVFLKEIRVNPSLKGAWFPVFIFFGFLFLSSWYFTAITNALRQGLALPFLYLSLSYFFDRRKIAGILLFVVSALFHYSSFLVLPFVALVFFSYRFIVFVFYALALLYLLGVNELVVHVLSDYSGLGVYEYIKNYAEKSNAWSGFQLDLFLYTLFWPTIIIIASFLDVFGRIGIVSVKMANQKYMILALPYFVFGFGGFSNRYAFICWMFIPVLQAIAVSNLNISIFSRSLISVLLMFFGALVYLINFA